MNRYVVCVAEMEFDVEADYYAQWPDGALTFYKIRGASSRNVKLEDEKVATFPLHALLSVELSDEPDGKYLA